MHLHEDVEIDSGRVGYGVAARRCYGRNNFLLLPSTLVGVLAVVKLNAEAVAHTVGDERCIVHSHHDEAAILLFSFGCDAQFDGRREGRSRQFLEQKVGHVPKRSRVSNIGVIQPQPSVVHGHTKELLVVGLPLPLQTEGRGVELVRLLWILLLRGLRFWHAPCHQRFAAITFLGYLTHYRPAVAPRDGLEENDTAIASLVVEVQKPVFTIRCVDPGTLVRPVDLRVALSHDALTFVRSEESL